MPSITFMLVCLSHSHFMICSVLGSNYVECAVNAVKIARSHGQGDYSFAAYEGHAKSSLYGEYNFTVVH